MKYKNKRLFATFFFLFLWTFLGASLLSAQDNFSKSATDMSPDLHHNPWDLIIYRPENAFPMNEIRCWMKIENEKGEDISKSAIRKATYEWISIPGVSYNYKRTPFLSGGMAMHLNMKPGKYKISFYTPKDEYSFVEYDFENKGNWKSNIFEYNTDNPAKVIFVYPTSNDNGFYNGGWVIDYKSPKYFKFTQPKMEGSY